MNRRGFLSFLAAAPVAAPFAAQAAMAAPKSGVFGLPPIKMGGEIVMPRKSSMATLGLKIDSSEFEVTCREIIADHRRAIAETIHNALKDGSAPRQVALDIVETINGPRRGEYIDGSAAVVVE